jgi:hypothetical protein
MTQHDELDLALGPEEPGLPTDTTDRRWARPRHRGPIVAVAVGIACLAAAAWFVWQSEPRARPAAQGTVGRADTEVAVQDDARRLGDGAAAELPPLDALDPVLRSMLGALSARPELARLLATDNLIRRFVAAVDGIGRGASPARQVTTLTPAGTFSVERPYAESRIARASHDRYAGLVETIASLDAPSVSRIYAQLRPRLDEAYAELGGPAEPFDAAMERALAHLLMVDPALAGGTVRPSAGVNFAWASADTERLSAAQKHLLRMGPDGAARVQAKLREVAEALGIPAARLARS